MKLRNQFIMAPIKLGYSDTDGMVKNKHIQFYSERSKYIGAITPEPFYLEKELREIPTQMGIDNDEKIAGLRKLTDSIHSTAAKVIAHLSHPGRMVNPKLPGNYYLSSTNQPCENSGAIPKRMEIADMEMIEKTMTLKKLKMKNVPIYTNTKVEAVDGDKVYLNGERQVTLAGVDKVVVTTGMKSYHPLAVQLKDKIPVYLIGDAKKVGKAQDAIRDAYVTAIKL